MNKYEIILTRSLHPSAVLNIDIVSIYMIPIIFAVRAIIKYVLAPIRPPIPIDIETARDNTAKPPIFSKPMLRSRILVTRNIETKVRRKSAIKI